MMPPAAPASRAQQLGALQRLAHERATGRRHRRVAGGARSRRRPGRRRPRRRAPGAARLGPRAARPGRSGGRAGAGRRRGPGGLAGRARARRLRRSSRRRSSATSSSRASTRRASTHGGHPYDALLADYDYGLTAARVQAIFGPLARGAAAAGGRGGRRGPRRPTSRCPSRRSEAAVARGPAPARRPRRALAGRRLRAPVQPGVGTSDTAGHDPLRGRAARVAAGGRARVRPRALRAPDRARAGAHEPRPRHVDVGARVPEQAVGEPRRRAIRAFAPVHRRRARGGRRRGRRRGAARRCSCACARR